MLNLFKTLQRRTPLGFLQLKHDPFRLLTAIAGITFADVLIFMQLGFSDALYTTNTQYPRALQTDLVILSTEAKNFRKLRTFARTRLYQAEDVPGVDHADPMYVASLEWRNPQTREKASMLIIGQNPDRPALNLPNLTQLIKTTRLPNHVLFDQAARGDYDAVIEQVQQGKRVKTAIGTRSVTITGLFKVGASFADDGALMTSGENFARLVPKQPPAAVNIGLVRLQPGANIQQVKTHLKARLPDDVQVLTSAEYLDFELTDIKATSPIGFVFGLGTTMGFIVGVVIVYQVLSTDVNSHLAEYATFKAMGYRNLYLLGVVFEEALILSVLGFIPSFVMALGAYQLTATATALPIMMPASRAVLVFVLTLVMCNVSGAVATRRLQAADPADIF